MTNAAGNAKKAIRSWLIDKLFVPPGADYQQQRFPQEKFDKILSGVDLDSVGSVLDIGCNEGVITEYFNGKGKFAVGIDVAPFFIRGVLRNLHRGNTPAFGVFNLTLENVVSLPDFDLILLLSVHHWWVKEHGDVHARKMVAELIARAKRYLVIEFSSIADKYGYKEPRFVDHDEDSVKEYAVEWLTAISPTLEVRYLGSNRETTGREQRRYIFLVERPELS